MCDEHSAVLSSAIRACKRFLGERCEKRVAKGCPRKIRGSTTQRKSHVKDRRGLSSQRSGHEYNETNYADIFTYGDWLDSRISVK